MSPDTPTAREIIVTGPTDDTLDRIARELVDARLIACADILDTPVTSTYRWQGAVETEPERRMHTRLDLAPSSKTATPTTSPTSPQSRSSPATPTTSPGSKP